MFSTIPNSVFLTMSLAIASSACSARLSSPVAPVDAVTACPGGTLHDAADASLYAACDSVTGDLHITQSSLTNLDALSRLRSVSGVLDISSNAELDDLEGLAQLSRVGGLNVRGNPNLDSLAGLEHLHHAANVSIVDNAELENLKGLGSLEYVDQLRIEHNGIHDTVGIANLRAVGTLVIKGNSKLISLSGFKGLERAGLVHIQNNPVVAAYYGLLPRLQRVTQLVLSNNSGLSQSDVRNMLERVERDAVLPIVASQAARREASLR